MAEQPTPPPKQAWVRAQVAEPIHQKAIYLRDRLGLANIPMAYTYLLHYAYWDKDPETIAQEMATSIGLVLPSLEPEQLPIKELETDD